MRSAALFIAVVATGNDDDFGSGCAINQPVFVVDPPRPIAREIRFERFRLANAFEWSAQDILNQPIDSFEQFAIMFLKP
jgi:hypothetical protein